MHEIAQYLKFFIGMFMMRSHSKREITISFFIQYEPF